MVNKRKSNKKSLDFFLEKKEFIRNAHSRAGHTRKKFSIYGKVFEEIKER